MATPEPVLRTTGLAKRYGKRLALAGLDLAVPPGRVFGFLGPNGAGKTTCISLILELDAAGGGGEQAEVLPRGGAGLEGSAFYPDLSARDNLRVWAAHSPGIDNRRGAELLDLVGLGTRAGDKGRTCSLGMKQRLAPAAALLHDPELLILDEPTNGLDPAGIREFRDLFRELGSRGKT